MRRILWTYLAHRDFLLAVYQPPRAGVSQNLRTFERILDKDMTGLGMCVASSFGLLSGGNTNA